MPSTPDVSVHFPHESLDVYRTATEFLVVAEAIAGALPKGRFYIADQLRRAALSIVLNVAEGAGEFAPVEKMRFYRMARRSGTECAAILDAATMLRATTAHANGTAVRSGRELLFRIVSMLSAMVLRANPRGAQGAEKETETE
jgi:four helix bundle protein